MSLWWSWNPDTDLMCDAINYALKKWTISVVAAGNEDKNVSNTVPG